MFSLPQAQSGLRFLIDGLRVQILYRFTCYPTGRGTLRMYERKVCWLPYDHIRHSPSRSPFHCSGGMENREPYARSAEKGKGPRLAPGPQRQRLSHRPTLWHPQGNPWHLGGEIKEGRACCPVMRGPGGPRVPGFPSLLPRLCCGCAS